MLKFQLCLIGNQIKTKTQIHRNTWITYGRSQRIQLLTNFKSEQFSVLANCVCQHNVLSFHCHMQSATLCIVYAYRIFVYTISYLNKWQHKRMIFACVGCFWRKNFVRMKFTSWIFIGNTYKYNTTTTHTNYTYTTHDTYQEVNWTAQFVIHSFWNSSLVRSIFSHSNWKVNLRLHHSWNSCPHEFSIPIHQKNSFRLVESNLSKENCDI